MSKYKGGPLSAHRTLWNTVRSSKYQYSIPILGDYLYRIDQVNDNLKREADYYKNTGRDYAYPSSGYGAQAYHNAGAIASDAMRMVGGQYKSMVNNQNKKNRRRRRR